MVLVPGTDELTVLLKGAAAGDPAALDRVFARVYEELTRIARSQRRRWQDNETLNTTALVHEAYLKLRGQDALRVESRVHFFAVAARAMRQILVNYAERQSAAKRGGTRARVELAEDVLPAFNPVAPDAADEFLELNEALERLESLDPRQVRVVECRFVVGLSIAETSEALEVSTATVKRDWILASSWLHRELDRRRGGGTNGAPARSR
jgi:RNA polymerase sigma factor (TIGR02999 family)